MDIGFIGCGNMASAIIKGIVESKVIKGENIYAYNPTESKTDNLAAKYGINKCKNAKEVVSFADYIVLAVKPNKISAVLNEINLELEKSNNVLISIAAGKTIEFIRDNLSHDNKIVRVMPNINAKVKESCTAYCANKKVTAGEKKKIEKIFGAVGTITEIDESMFPLFGVIAGCSPAFAYMFIDALARAAIKNGMKKDEALKFAAQSVYGSAKMISESDCHPFELIDRVCSPGGTTIEGVISLQKDGFESAVHNAVEAAVDKDKKL